MTNKYSATVFNLITTVTFAYVGLKLIKTYLVNLCSLFGNAALAYAVYDILIKASNNNYSTNAVATKHSNTVSV